MKKHWKEREGYREFHVKSDKVKMPESLETTSVCYISYYRFLKLKKMQLGFYLTTKGNIFVGDLENKVKHKEN